MKMILGILAMGLVFWVSLPVAAQFPQTSYQQQQEQQKQDERDAYLQGLADGRMGKPPMQYTAGMRAPSDPVWAAYRKGYDDGEKDQQRNDYDRE